MKDLIQQLADAGLAVSARGNGLGGMSVTFRRAEDGKKLFGLFYDQWAWDHISDHGVMDALTEQLAGWQRVTAKRGDADGACDDAS